jgi:hypothetical protein
MEKNMTDHHSAEGLRDWLIQRIADYVQRPASEISATEPLVAADIEDYLGIVVEATVMWDNPTIDALSGVLMDELAKTPAPGH